MTRYVEQTTTPTLVYRKPTLNDAAAVHSLVERCGPLDLNSNYAYLLLCTHFAETCVVAERQGMIAGFVSGYRKPQDPSVLFVWQVAVDPRARGQGLGKRLLAEILQRPTCATIRHVEATINPSNKASWAMFESLARDLGAECARETLFRSQDFGPQSSHEEEHLLRIGPL